MAGGVVKLEQAKSGRSTCRASGEPIAKGEWRVGFETWISGRVAVAWMKLLPFLESCCRVEYALSAGGSQGACKSTGHKFVKGEPRFVLTAGDPQKKCYLSLPAAGAELAPVVERVGHAAWAPTRCAGLADLAAQDRSALYEAFGVSQAEAAAFDQQHPAPQRPSTEKPSPAAKAAAAAASGGSSKGRPAKRARVAQASESSGSDSEEEEEEEEQEAEAGEGAGAGEEGEPQQANEQQEQEQEQQGGKQKKAGQQGGGGLTEMERQRLELIKRNRERMMALNLPGMAQELMTAAPAKQQQPAKHKGVSRKRLSEVLPRRESSRLRGIAADGSMIHAERQGEITVVAGEVIRRYASGAMAEEQEPQDRHPQGEVQFESSNASPESDEAFIQLLAHAAAAANSGTLGGEGTSSPGGQASSKTGGKRKGARGGSNAGGSSAGAAKAAGGLGAADLTRLQLAEDDVAKVTKEATTHLAFHPTTDTLIVACTDKKGNVSLWHVNEGSYELPAAAWRSEPILRRGGAADVKEEQQEQEQQQEAEEEGGAGEEGGKPAATSAAAVSLDASGSRAGRPGSRTSSRSASEEGAEAGPFDGVLLLQPQHYQYVSGLRWAGGSGRGAALFTASYDGSLRRLDVERGVSDALVSSEEDEYSCMDVTGDGRTALLGDNEGMLRVVDVRAPPAGSSLGPALGVHAKKINTVHFEPTQEQVFATASTDTTIKLWDMRALTSSKGGTPKPLAAGGHPQACQAALFAPDGSRRLVSTSFDNTCRVWDGSAGMRQLLAIKHDNQTGRWVLPFRACWNAAGDGIIVGNMNRFVDIFDAGNGALAGQLSSPFMTAIPSRNAAHPHLPVLAAATNSGRIHIYR